MKKYILASVFLFFAAQVQAQSKNSGTGDCFIVDYKILEVPPPQDADIKAIFKRAAIASIPVERPSLSGAEYNCEQFSDFFRKFGPKRWIGKVSTVLVIRERLYEIDQL